MCVELTSLCTAGLDAIMKGHIFVGIVDTVLCQSMIQHQTKLYLVQHAAIACVQSRRYDQAGPFHADFSMCRQELFYQLGLRQFGRFSRINLTPPPRLEKLVRLAVDRACADGSAAETVAAQKDDIVQVRDHYVRESGA